MTINGNARRVAGILTLLAAIGLLPSIVAGADAPGEVVATLNGQAVSRAAFRKYLNHARGQGYRPATRAEATRLLRRYLCDELINQELVKAQQANQQETWATVESRLLERFGEPKVEVSNAEIRAFVARHGFTAHPGDGADTEPLSEALSWLQAQRLADRRRRILDYALESQAVEIYAQVLDSEVATGSNPEGPPPLPPGVGR